MMNNKESVFILKALNKDIYIKKIMPSDYLITPFQWGDINDAKVFPHDRAKQIKERLKERHIQTILQEVAEE